jgi:hypothetical protein
MSRTTESETTLNDAAEAAVNAAVAEYTPSQLAAHEGTGGMFFPVIKGDYVYFETPEGDLMPFAIWAGWSSLNPTLPLIGIDTEGELDGENGPRLRVSLNDADVYDDDPGERHQLEEALLETHSWIARYAVQLDHAIHGPLEKFIGDVGKLTGIEFPLVDPATRAPATKLDGTVLLQKDHRLGMTHSEVDRLRDS